MPSQYQPITLEFTAGVDTKSSDIAIAPPKLADLQNGAFNANGVLSKRFGTQALPNRVVPGDVATYNGETKLQAGDALATYNDQLLAISKGQLYNYAESAAGWVPVGPILASGIKVRPLTRAQPTASDPSSVTHSQGVAACAYATAAGDVRITVWDSLSGSVYLGDSLVAAGATRPICVAHPTRPFLYVFYGLTSAGTDSETFVRRIDVGNPAVLGVATPLARAANGGFMETHPAPGKQPVFDVTSDGTQLIAMVRLAGFTNPSKYLFGPLNARGGFSGKDAGESFDTYIVPAAINGEPGITFALQLRPISDTRLAATGLNGSGSPTLLLLRADSALGYVAEGYASVASTQPLYGFACNMAAGAAASTLFTEANPLPDGKLGFVTAIEYGGTEATAGTASRGVFLDLWVLEEGTSTPFSGTLTPNNLPKLALRNGALISQTIRDPSENPQWLVSYVSPTQQTLFLLGVDGIVQGKALPTLAGGPTVQPGALTGVDYVDGGARIVVQQALRLLSEDGQLKSAFGLSTLNLEFAPTGRYQSAQLQDSLYICGAQLWHYDGQSLTEDGFHLFPGAPAATPSASGGSMDAGTRNYRALFAWQDKNGNVHRSAPSLPVAVTHTGSTASTSLLLDTLRLTNKQNVQLELYRTPKNEANYYLVTSPTAPLANLPAQDTVAFTDTLSDAAIRGNQLLYTVGGVLDADGPPPMLTVVAGQRRLFGLPNDDPNTLWYSQEYSSGTGTAWSQALVKPMPLEGGEARALGVMDDKVVAFKTANAYYFGGDGPTPNGLDDRFSPWVQISSDTGCGNQDSMVLTQDGLMMQTQKGIRLLSRNLSWVDVGADVTLYNGETVTSANQMPNINQVRFTTQAGRALVYDTYWRRPNAVSAVVGQWTTFTNYVAQDAAVWRDRFVLLQADGRVRQEIDGSYLDGASYVSQVVTTAWIKPAGEQGQARIRRLMLLGNFLSPHTLTVRIAYDFGPYVETYRFVPREVLSGRTWGGIDGTIDPNPAYDPNESWGGEPRWGGEIGEDGVYRLRIDPARRRCQAIRLEISDATDALSTELGAGYSLNVLSMEVAAQGTLRRPSLNKQAR